MSTKQPRRHSLVAAIGLVLLLLIVALALSRQTFLSLPLAPLVPGVRGEEWYIVAAGGDLWAMGGNASVQLTHAGDLAQPAWSSSGLIYVKRQKNSSDLWLIDANRKQTRLTQASSSVVEDNNWMAQPVPVPGGNQFYVLSDRDKASTGIGDLAIWVFDWRQKSFQQLTRPQEYTGGDQDLTVNPRQPNDLVFSRYGYADNGQLTEQLYWLDRTKLTAIPLTPPERLSRQAAFAPNGVHLAFVQASDGGEVLYVGQVRVSQGKPQLVNVQQVAAGVNAQPVWSGDGSSLAYLKLQDRQFQLWTLTISAKEDGSLVFGSPRQITYGPSLDATSRPLWVSDADAKQIQSWFNNVAPTTDRVNR